MNAILLEVKNQKQEIAIRAFAEAIGSRYTDARDISLGLFLNQCRESKSLSLADAKLQMSLIRDEINNKK